LLLLLLLLRAINIVFLRLVATEAAALGARQIYCPMFAID